MGALTGSLRRMRHYIRDYDVTSNSSRQPSSAKALAWFGNMTIYVNALFNIQRSMKELVSKTMYGTYRSDLLAIMGFGVFLFAALPMCSLVAKGIYAVSQQLPKFHVLLLEWLVGIPYLTEVSPLARHLLPYHDTYLDLQLLSLVRNCWRRGCLLGPLSR